MNPDCQAAAPRPQAQPGLDAFAETAAAIARQQQVTEFGGKHHGWIADGVDTAGNARIDLAQRDLVADQDGGLEAGAAGPLDVEARSLGIEPRRQHAFAHQVEVLRVLQHRAGNDIAQPLSRQPEAVDDAAQHGGEHVLVALLRIGAVGAGEGNAGATDDGDSPYLRSCQHGQIPCGSDCWR
jgi:hypothetical protein